MKWWSIFWSKRESWRRSSPFGSSLYLFFGAAILFSVITLALYEPRALAPRQNLGAEGVALELGRFVYHEITPQGVAVIAQGERAQRDALGERVEGLKLSRFFQEEKRLEVLESPLTLKCGERLHFPEGVSYAYNAESHLQSERGVYDLKERFFKGEGRFWLTRALDKAEGVDISYQARAGIVEAKEIKVKLEMGR